MTIHVLSFEIVQELKLDRSAYLREVLRKRLSLDKQDRLLLKLENILD